MVTEKWKVTVLERSTFAVSVFRHRRKQKARQDWDRLKRVILWIRNAECCFMTLGDLPLQYLLNLLEPALASDEVLNNFLDFVPPPTTADKPRINMRKIRSQARRVMTFYAAWIVVRTQKQVNKHHIKLRAQMSGLISNCWPWLRIQFLHNWKYVGGSQTSFPYGGIWSSVSDAGRNTGYKVLLRLYKK
jgi:hypothetical protein